MTREELLKNAKPILFNTEMVKAILEDRKTVTRRVIKLDLGLADTDKNDSSCLFVQDKYGDSINVKDLCQYQVGDILYVRETYQPMVSEKNEVVGYHYNADGLVIWTDGKLGMTAKHIQEPLKWKPSIHMPKSEARIFLKVTNVRVERLHDINGQFRHDDILKEGYPFGMEIEQPPINMFEKLWNTTINKQDLDSYGWEANPYVWVIEFEKVELLKE